MKKRVLWRKVVVSPLEYPFRHPEGPEFQIVEYSLADFPALEQRDGVLLETLVQTGNPGEEPESDFMFIHADVISELANELLKLERSQP